MRPNERLMLDHVNVEGETGTETQVDGVGVGETRMDLVALDPFHYRERVVADSFIRFESSGYSITVNAGMWPKFRNHVPYVA